MRFLFTFHQLVDAWRKFANSASKVTMLRNNGKSKLQEFFYLKANSDASTRKLWIQVFVKTGSCLRTTRKTFAYH